MEAAYTSTANVVLIVGKSTLGMQIPAKLSARNGRIPAFMTIDRWGTTLEDNYG